MDTTPPSPSLSVCCDFTESFTSFLGRKKAGIFFSLFHTGNKGGMSRCCCRGERDKLPLGICVLAFLTACSKPYTPAAAPLGDSRVLYFFFPPKKKHVNSFHTKSREMAHELSAITIYAPYIYFYAVESIVIIVPMCSTAMRGTGFQCKTCSIHTHRV